MADRLLLYYKFVSEHSGLSGKIKLAQLTKVPSIKAALEPDEPLIIDVFKHAVTEITGKPAPEF
jgi:hypothetical protein